MIDSLSPKQAKAKAGHQEVQGETIAKFEFFDHGFYPYSRYLDIDKVDLILRRREGGVISYAEVQVKYGRLYQCGPAWERKLFDYTSWRFFKPEEFADAHPGLFIAYVLAYPSGYRGDMFIFPVQEFHALIGQAILKNSKTGPRREVLIAHAVADDRWYLWRKRGFEAITPEVAIDVTHYRRNFGSLGVALGR